MPLVLRLDSRVDKADVTAVLTAVVNQHDALRMRLVDRAGMWEQQISGPAEFTDLAERVLPADAAQGTAQEREALHAIVSEAQNQDLDAAALTATYVVDSQDAARYLVLTVHGMVDDPTSREVLVTDLLTGFGQRLARSDIALEPVTTSWRDWSQRCAALAAHPAVTDRRGYWVDNEATATVRLADVADSGAPGPADLVRVAIALTAEQTSLVDNAAGYCRPRPRRSCWRHWDAASRSPSVKA